LLYLHGGDCSLHSELKVIPGAVEPGGEEGGEEVPGAHKGGGQPRDAHPDHRVPPAAPTARQADCPENQGLESASIS